VQEAGVRVGSHEQQPTILASERQSLVVRDRGRELEGWEGGRARNLLDQLDFDWDERVRVNERAEPHFL
jgi:hypothetical protein